MKLSKRRLIKMINFYPPYIGAGIRMIELADDFSSCTVRLKLRWWNKNLFGTQFGGSLYAMADPFFVLLLTQTLDHRDYIIWDKAATIRFKRPGKSDVSARFEIPPEKVAQMKTEVAAAGGTKDFTFHTQILDREGMVVAEVDKVIYVRKKEERG